MYNNASLQIESKEHIGLLGKNGCGKTTLINIILNSDDYIFGGSVWKQKNARIEYVSQFLDNSHEFMNKTVEQGKRVLIFDSDVIKQPYHVYGISKSR